VLPQADEIRAGVGGEIRAGERVVDGEPGVAVAFAQEEPSVSRGPGSVEDVARRAGSGVAIVPEGDYLLVTEANAKLLSNLTDLGGEGIGAVLWLAGTAEEGPGAWVQGRVGVAVVEQDTAKGGVIEGAGGVGQLGHGAMQARVHWEGRYRQTCASGKTSFRQCLLLQVPFICAIVALCMTFGCGQRGGRGQWMHSRTGD
jgi:hypothetical protein